MLWWSNFLIGWFVGVCCAIVAILWASVLVTRRTRTDLISETAPAPKIEPTQVFIASERIQFAPGADPGENYSAEYEPGRRPDAESTED